MLRINRLPLLNRLPLEHRLPLSNRLPLAGFTLVEVLVTLVILALLGLAAANVVQTMVRSKESSEAAIERLAQLQYFMLTLEQDMRLAVPRRNVTGQLLFAQDERLALVRGSWFNPQSVLPRSELQPVFYTLRDGNLVREFFPYVDVSPGVDPVEQIVLNGVERMQLRFYSRPPRPEGVTAGLPLKVQPGRWSGRWDEPNALPLAIEITLSTEFFGEISRVFLLPGGDFSERSATPREGDNGNTIEPPQTPLPDGQGPIGNRGQGG